MTAIFELSGKSFEYAVSDYNSTRVSERAVEVPVGLALLTQALRDSKQVLEVGAVLPHYREPSGRGWSGDAHTVIDLHEEYPGVINADVLTWEPPRAYDLIISISTLDHLHDLEELIDALRRLRRWLEPGGLLFITLPFGQPAWVGGGEWIDRFVLGENDAKASWRMDKIDPLDHLWAQVNVLGPQSAATLPEREGGPTRLEVDMTIPPLAYHGPSLFANTVYMLLWGDVAGWWQR